MEKGSAVKYALLITSVGGFISQFEMNDVKLLREYGFCVHYASNFSRPVYRIDEEKLAHNGVILHQIVLRKSPFQLLENGRAIWQLSEIIDQEKIDLIHCHTPMGGVAARLAAYMSKRNPYVIYTAHGFHFYHGAPLRNWILYYTAERFLARYTDQLITINREDYLRAKTFRLKRGGSVAQIHGVGVDFDRFQERAELRAAMRHRLEIPERGFHIVSAAELNKNKNQKTIIQSVAALDDSDIYYSICGGGPGEETLRRSIAELGLDGRVRLLGYRDDLDAVLQSADCFAFPSFREGLGVAAIEALACGIPVLAADNRGTREYMKDGVNGIVCKAGDVGAFAQAIKRLKTDERFRRELSRNCRSSVYPQFSMEDVDWRMRRIYQAAVEALEG